jgi:hypothetical protein
MNFSSPFQRKLHRDEETTMGFAAVIDPLDEIAVLILP